MAALRVASRRVGATSSASIEPDRSTTSITEARSRGTAKVACGRASATASTAAASAMSAAGRWRRHAGAAPATLATTAAPGWRSA